MRKGENEKIIIWIFCDKSDIIHFNMKPPKAIADAFPKRPADMHKRTAGVVTVVGGSVHFVHAPVIAGLGARAAGAGLVQLVVPDASRIAAGALLPEATLFKRSPTCVPPKSDVTAIGMGLGVSADSEALLLRLLAGSPERFVLDADALNILAKWQVAGKSALSLVEGREVVITPHAGEAARLLGCASADIDRDRIGAVRALVNLYHAVAVLKGPHTLVAAPDRAEVFTCDAGNPFMALGGMGDLLSGMIAARWAATKKVFEAVCAAVWLHSAASDSLVSADPPEDPNIVNTARAAASIRVRLERTSP